jgi:hypothetical protein
VGNGGKVVERQRARELRADAWTLADIATELSVAKSSVSRWVEDVQFEPSPRRTSRKRSPNRLQRAKQAEIERCHDDGIERVGEIGDREFLMAGLGLYAGDGSKTPGSVRFANSNPAMVKFFCDWLRRFFEVDEPRLRIQLYLHADLDLDSAMEAWVAVTGIPPAQFTKAYRAVVDETRRHNRYVHGCCHVVYSSTRVHREIMGLLDAFMSVPVRPRLWQETVECSSRSC